MPLEQLLVFAVMLLLATVNGLIRWRRGLASSRDTGVPANFERGAEERPRGPFETVEVEPPRIVETKASPRSLSQQRQQEVSPQRRPHLAHRMGARPAQPRSPHAGASKTGLIPKDGAELRRAVALVAILGPPRAIDPPK